MSESGKPSHANLQVKADKSHGGEFGYVGIDAILEQMRRKAMKQGFELNLMVVGTSDLRSSGRLKNKQMLTILNAKRIYFVLTINHNQVKRRIKEVQ